MDRAAWGVAVPLLDTALTLPPGQLEVWLRELDVKQPGAAPLLRRLLAAHRKIETNAIWETLPRAQGASTERALAELPKRIGPFEILKPLGQGGMGWVWLARYADGILKRSVALKLPSAQRISPGLRERFARERDFLALLEHPHIARLYEAGVSEEGQPYLAMEYVEGVVIDAHCNQARMSLNERLRLFLDVLSAVQFAHRNLILHRDLKPGNVMVNPRGEVKLLDFGIAKLLPVENSIAAATELTQMAGAALTPAYAAPEQIAGGAVTIATDVYALGVMLYRLLTGSQPYKVERDTRGALEEAILTGPPVMPSDAPITREHAQACASSQSRLRRALRGDLDTIVLKTLKKDPTERYATVDAFAQDIGRALQGYRILARPDSTWYRSRKFVQRHPWAVGVSSAGVVAMVAVAAVALWQASEARKQTVYAQHETERARAVQQFLVTLFQSANPEQSRGKQITVIEVLDRGAPRIEAEFVRQPETAAALSGEIGAIYESLGDLDKASSYLARKVAMLESLGAQSSVDYVDANERLGRYLVNLERYTEAEAPLARALAQAAKLEPAAREQRLHAALTMGLLKQRIGKHSESRSILTATRDEIVSLTNITSKLAWLADEHLAEVEFAHGAYEQARQLHLSALQRMRQDSAAEIIDVLIAETNLAQIEFKLRHLDAAQRRYQSLVERLAQHLGPAANDTLSAKSGLARTIAAKGDYARAIALQHEVIAAANDGRDAGAAVRAQAFQARNLIGSLQYAAARRLTEGALAYFSGLQPGPTRLTERMRALLAEIQFAMNETPEAEATVRLALTHQGELFDSGSPQIAQTLDILGAILRAQGRYAEAAQSHQRSLSIHLKAFGPDDIQTLRSELYLALARIGSGERNASENFARARALLSKELGPDHPAQVQLALATSWTHLSPEQRSARKTAGPFRLIDF